MPFHWRIPRSFSPPRRRQRQETQIEFVFLGDLRALAVKFFFLLIGLLAPGCAQNNAAPAEAQVSGAAPSPAPAPSPPRPPATRPVAIFIDLMMYQIYVPAGSVSRNTAFWEKLDATDIPSDADELLERNGVRVRQGEVKNWPDYKRILDAAGADTIQGHYIAPMARGQEIQVSNALPEQTLFFFDDHGAGGLVYDQCMNFLVLGFAPSPDGAHAVRLELSPLVRAMRRHYEYSVLNGRDTVSFVSDEHLYDLGLRTDLSPGKFLVVAPAPASRRVTSIGHQFFTQDQGSHRREMVMIFVVNAMQQAVSSQVIRP
jgi:hypothetical protein